MGELDRSDNVGTTPTGASGEDVVEAAWQVCLERLRASTKVHVFAVCLNGSLARATGPRRLEVTVTPFGLTRIQEAGLQAKVHETVAAVMGEGWDVSWRTDGCAPIHHDDARVEPVARMRPRARRSREERPRRPPVEEAAGDAAPSAPTSRYNFDSFVVGASNELATQAARSVAEQPGRAYNPLLICGGSGLGKTHLMNAVGNRIVEKNPSARVTYATTETFTNEMVESFKGGTAAFRRKYRNVDCLLIDDVQELAGKERTQVELHNTFDDLMRRGCQIILTSDKPPRLLSQLQERLCSRLSSGLIADIQQPCRELCAEILRRWTRDRGAGPITEEAVQFIAEHFGSNMRKLQGALNQVLHHAGGRRLLDLDLACRALERIHAAPAPTPTLTMSVILDKVSQYYRVNVADLTGKRRDRRYSSPRHVAMFLAHRLGTMGVRQIGEAFGGKDYSSVQHAVKKVEALQSEPAIRCDLRNLATMLGTSLD